jgi:hypothetical protein
MVRSVLQTAITHSKRVLPNCGGNVRLAILGQVNRQANERRK